MDQSEPHYTMLTYIGNDVFSFFFIATLISLSLYYRYFFIAGYRRLSPIFISDRTKCIAAGLQDSRNALVASALLLPVGEDDRN